MLSVQSIARNPRSQVMLYLNYRWANKSKKKKQKIICASLNNVFSKPVTPDDGTSGDSAHAAVENLETTLCSAEITTSQCVAYTAIPPSMSPKRVAPEMYEDVAL